MQNLYLYHVWWARWRNHRSDDQTPVEPGRLLSTLRYFFMAVVLGSLASAAHPAPSELQPLRTIADIRRLEPEAAAKKLPLEIEARVTLITPRGSGAFVDDGHHGIFVDLKKTPPATRGIPFGTLVRITGFTDPGEFAPHVIASSMVECGPATEVQPQLVTNHLSCPTLDCRWVSFQCTLLMVKKVAPQKQFHVLASSGGRKFLLKMPIMPGVETHIEALLHRSVMVKAVACTYANSSRQLRERYFQLVKAEDMESLHSEPVPFSEINKLCQKDYRSGQLVRTRGTVIYSDESFLSLHGGGKSMGAQLKRDGKYKVGDIIEVTGQMAMQSRMHRMYVISDQKVGEIAPPAPVPVKNCKELLNAKYDNCLVTVTGTILSLHNFNNSNIIHCEQNNQRFEALIKNTDVDLMEKFQPGAELSLTGMCSIWQSDAFLVDSEKGNNISLYLRSFDDIQIIKNATWFTQQRLLQILGIVGVIGVSVAAWAVSLRRKVALQTTAIRSVVKREEVLNERQRLARELHDTIEQNIGGVSLQLSNLESQLGRQNVEGTALNSLALARRMVSHCRSEAREAIMDLRSATETAVSLEQLLNEGLLYEAESMGIELSCTTEGTAVPIPAETVRNVMRIIHEALANALRHAGAGKINLRFAYTGESLTATVTDDGTGFHIDAEVPEGRFGLMGMRERASRIQAKLTITSLIDIGTTVTLSIPLHHSAAK